MPRQRARVHCRTGYFFSSSLLLSSLELNETKFHEPYIRARLGTAAHLCIIVLRQQATVSTSISVNRGSTDALRSSTLNFCLGGQRSLRSKVPLPRPASLTASHPGWSWKTTKRNCLANLAQTREPRPGSHLGFQVKVLKTL